MLSRTAANLFWMGRHLERAETAARLLDVGQRITLLPNTEEGYRNEWESLLRSAGARGAFASRYGDAINQDNIVSWLFFDCDNPSSVASCIERAREGGRIVRTALTSQVWDALNTAYQELRDLKRQPRDTVDTAMLTDFTTRHGSTVRGAINATQLRSDGWHFINLGYSLERADATSRLLDVKYFVLLPRVEFVGSGLDNYQWQVILRALSAHRAFHWAYGGDITASKVADFLILNGESPRSLLTSLYEAVWNLDGLVRRYGEGVPATASVKARQTLESLMARDIDAIFDEGLHEFLTWFIGEIGAISDAVHDDYFSGRM
ncbi:alpha-E domain-containing protein [Paracoccus yeei]|uniref:Alpha-E domain-containing protein n=1 Tax=Paracoccus yeei TaxID=147645 RepID=A0A5P2QW07_9RHOB|nr:alpha-E domain-containing protein [Paracoccus yeei]MBY0135670.1 alpha-E domain-containing protein [Paracoccus yeei]QEU10145.1 alpha-E domain-containing protein [Paracoccus yeei]